MRENGMLTRENGIVDTITDGVINELLSDCSELKYEALGNLFRSELWGRLWTWQELIVAKKIHLQWDTHSIKLDDLWILFSIIQGLIVKDWSPSMPKSLDLLIANPPNMSPSKLWDILRLRTRRRIWQHEKVLPLLRLLDSARGANSTDPRDRVFALCGLGDPKFGIVPDYKATVQQVYTSTATAIMEQEQSLDVLAYCKNSGVASPMAIPTWCPDWSTDP
jgi:hypothetical protein